MTDPIIILCQNEIKGNPNNLIDFLSKHGQDVVSVVDDGIIFKGGSHYVLSRNDACTGCQHCDKREIQ